MRKLFFILLLLIGGVSMGQTWQPAGFGGIIYNEYNTGTYITLTHSAIKIVTTPDYSAVVTPNRFIFTIYDSIGHFVEKIDSEYPNTSPEVCKKIYKYITATCGSFIFTIYGDMYYPGTICYSIEDYTYNVYIRYKRFIESSLRY